MNELSRVHPAALFFYYAATVTIGMLLVQPIAAAILLGGAVSEYCAVCGVKKLGKSFALSVPFAAVYALTNPLFVQEGDTVLFYIFSIKYTLEALFYGCTVAASLTSVFYRFMSYNRVMAGGKFNYLFSPVAPRLTMLFTVTFGLIPKLSRYYKNIEQSQKALGLYSTDKFTDKVRGKLRVTSVLITRSIENAMDTADSMRARGYALKGRTRSINYKFRYKDAVFSAYILIFTVLIIILMIFGGGDYVFYPTAKVLGGAALRYTLYGAITLLSFAGTAKEIQERILWRYLQSKI